MNDSRPALYALLVGIDEWLSDGRPERASDACWDSKGNRIAAGRSVWDGPWNGQPAGACLAIGRWSPLLVPLALVPPALLAEGATTVPAHWHAPGW